MGLHVLGSVFESGRIVYPYKYRPISPAAKHGGLVPTGPRAFVVHLEGKLWYVRTQ